MIGSGSDVDRKSVGFTTVRRFGPSAVLAGILPVDDKGEVVAPGDIEAQTHAVFRNLRATLQSTGMRIGDLLRLNTYYVGNVPEHEVTPNRHNARHIMPVNSWDWSLPVPFSQGWRIGERIWVGGQISADRKGRARHPGDAVRQTETIMEFIRDVLADADAGMEDLCHLKICYQYGGDAADAEARLDQIMQVISGTCDRLHERS